MFGGLISSLAKYIPTKAKITKPSCIKFRYSENIKAPNIVATIGCIKSPIEPKDAVSLGMLYVIKNWPPTWQSIAMANKLYISVLLEGKKSLDSIIAGINPNKHVNSVV